MSKEPRMTAQTMKVLFALTAGSRRELSGAEIALETKLMSGTLYPILMRLEEAAWLESWWETDEPTALGRPRRRVYRVTAKGAKAADDVARDVGVTPLGFRWGRA